MRPHRRATHVLAATLASALLLLTGCSDGDGDALPAASAEADAAEADSAQDAASQDAADQIEIPPSVERVEVPDNFPKDFPMPPSPHAVVGVDHGGRGLWSLMAYYAKGLDLTEEKERFRTALVKEGFSIEKSTPMAVAPGPEAIWQSTLVASKGSNTVTVVFEDTDGQTPWVTVMTAPS